MTIGATDIVSVSYSGWYYLFEVMDIINDFVYPLPGSIVAAKNGDGTNFQAVFPKTPSCFHISQCNSLPPDGDVCSEYHKAKGV